MPSYDGSTFITAKLQAEDIICITAILLLYILQENQRNKFDDDLASMPCGLISIY
jgi:hypothetical protein